MALKQIEGETTGGHSRFARVRQRATRVRAWLRHAMPRVAIAAAVLLIARMLLSRTYLFGDNPLGGFLEFLSSSLIFITLLYYGLKALRWMKRRLLWRVRRRLIVTYLFVGLTPVILLALFGMVASFGVSSEAMARIITAQMNATDEETARSAETVADAFAQLPANATDQNIEAWLNERAAILRGSLPGARLVLWRGAGNEDPGSLGHQSPAQFVAETDEEEARGVGPDKTPYGAPLPEWLRGRDAWHGLAFLSPEERRENFSTPSFRALVRRKGTQEQPRPFTVLVVVPISRALVARYRETTGIYVRPFFGAIRLVMGRNSFTFDTNRRSRIPNENDRAINDGQQQDRRETERNTEELFNRDQLGEPVSQEGRPYVVFSTSIDWRTGVDERKLSFLFDWSWAIAGRQFLGRSDTGELWWQILKVVSIIFLVLELLALLAAAWMTRAVTSSVHKLYRATQYIKRGDFSYRVKVRSRDQLGELAGSFNDMAANIESLLQERVKRERLEREVELAHEVQSRLFPSRVPDLLTLEAAAECRAARGVAGDYYDYIEIAPGLVVFALGDVSGKGMSASLVMSNLQASLRAQTAIIAERLSIAERAVAASATTGGDKTLARVVADADIDGAIARKVTNINAQLCQSTDANRFATLFLNIYEDRTRTLRYTNAGHNAPILVRVDGTVERLTTGGMMVGAFEWATYEEGRTQLEAGDVLVIYSDGITEAERAPNEEYGEERLIRLVINHRHLSAHEIREAIFNDVDAWSAQAARGDDQTLVIMKSQG